VKGIVKYLIGLGCGLTAYMLVRNIDALIPSIPTPAGKLRASIGAGILGNIATVLVSRDPDFSYGYSVGDGVLKLLQFWYDKWRLEVL